MLEGLEPDNEVTGPHLGTHHANSHAEKMLLPASGERSHAAANAISIWFYNQALKAMRVQHRVCFLNLPGLGFLRPIIGPNARRSFYQRC